MVIRPGKEAIVAGLRLVAAVAVLVGLGAGVAAAQQTITLGSTTSTENSGLFAHILPAFTQATGVKVRVVAVGTGQALELARRGDVDVLLVHSRADEERFVAEGYGVERRDVMYNDFVVVGPSADPAGAAAAPDAEGAFRAIADAQAVFASRGDDSGTHKAELGLWEAAGIAPAGGWYRETGSGMGATLNYAAEAGAYTLADRGTWLSFGNRGDLAVAFESDPALFNPYGVILVNPALHPHVNAEGGQAFVDWITSPAGQAAIGGFRIDGDTLFFPDAGGD